MDNEKYFLVYKIGYIHFNSIISRKKIFNINLHLNHIQNEISTEGVAQTQDIEEDEMN